MVEPSVDDRDVDANRRAAIEVLFGVAGVPISGQRCRELVEPAATYLSVLEHLTKLDSRGCEPAGTFRLTGDSDA
jgi:hypothetical protein